MRNFALETYFSRWEFSARYHLTASDMESMRMSELLPTTQDRFRIGFGRKNIDAGLAALGAYLNRTQMVDSKKGLT